MNNHTQNVNPPSILLTKTLNNPTQYRGYNLSANSTDKRQASLQPEPLPPPAGKARIVAPTERELKIGQLLKGIEDPGKREHYREYAAILVDALDKQQQN